MTRRTILTGMVLLCLGAGLCGLWLRDSTRGFPHQNLESDEVFWTAFSYMGFHVAFVQRNPSHEIWLLGDPFVGMTPWLGKLLLGGYLHALGLSKAWNPRVVHWEYRESLGWNINNLTVPAFSAIAAGRAFMIPFGVGCALVLSYLLLNSSCLLGVVFFLLLAFHPLFARLSTRVYMDMPALFFSALALFFLLYGRAMTTSARPLRLGFLAAAGICAGFAAACKMREILVIGFFGLIWGLSLFRVTSNRLFAPTSRESLKLGIILLIAVTTFFAVNPGSYLDPVTSFFLFWNLGAFQQEEVKVLKPQDSLFSWQEKAERFWQVLFDEFARHAFSSPWEIAFALGGLVSLLISIRRERFSLENPEHLLFAYFLLIFAANLWWLPQRYERYFVPCLFLLCLLQARGITCTLYFLTGRWFSADPKTR